MKDREKSRGFFEPTVWSTIVKAKKGKDDTTRHEALDRLLHRYYQPILLEIRHSLPGRERDAEDLAHSFIVNRFHRSQFLANVSPENGRFRNWVKASIRYYLCDQFDKAKARGGTKPHLPIDPEGADDKAPVDPPAPLVEPGLVLDRAWAEAVLSHSREELRRECLAEHKENLFEALERHLGGESKKEAAAQIADRLGMTEGAVHTAMSRMRSRLGALIREEVKQTVGSQDDWRDELKYLIELMGK